MSDHMFDPLAVFTDRELAYLVARRYRVTKVEARDDVRCARMGSSIAIEYVLAALR